MQGSIFVADRMLDSNPGYVTHTHSLCPKKFFADGGERGYYGVKEFYDKISFF